MACEICKKPYVPPTDNSSFDFNEKPHVCNVCGKSFSLKIQLKRHMLSHEGDVPYICNTCEKHLDQPSYNLRLSEKGNFTCETCNRNFPSKRLLLRHANEHTLENAVNCEECGLCFKNIRALKRHAVVHRPKKDPPKNNPRKGATKMSYVCDDCGKKFFKLHLLEKHLLTHRYPRKCDACGENFKLNKLLEEHKLSGDCKIKNLNNSSLDSSNTRNDLKSLDDKKHLCSLCDKNFTRKSALEGHMASHFEDFRESTVEDDSDMDADFQCNYKGDSKSSEQVKRLCLPKLKIRRSYPCEKCDVVCSSKKSFDKHIATHKIIRPAFQCEKCDIVCSSKKSFDKHVATHEPIQTIQEPPPEAKKPHICRFCNEAFGSKEKLKKHKMSHNTQVAENNSEGKERKTYACQICTNVFHKRRHLRRHIKCHFNVNDPNETSSLSSEDIQLGKKPKRNKNYSCNFCGKLFAGETCLKKHEAKHTEVDEDTSKEKKGKKPKNLTCEFCNKEFIGQRHLYIKHKLNHTPEVCGICDARFVDRASLREHCRIHIGTEEGRRFIECSQKALNAKNGVAPPEPKVEYIYLVLR